MNNIEIGIDLGTTNSEIAIFNNGNIEIAKNTYGNEFTPSVFGVDKAKNEQVGKKPYERYYKPESSEELKNNKPEIKRLMGTKENIYFARIDKSYNAEQISAKILESLRQDAIRKKNDINVSAAVITIPAYFSTIQAEATKRAGLLAGFKYVLLLQEPIAAAMSYGFGKSENENWLVYDLGGGTFDSALISSKEGNLKVLSHSGDNFLGGKDIDALIVDKIILPVIIEKYNLNNFERSNDKCALAFSKLKYAAEQAKIQLSATNEVNIEIDFSYDGIEVYENILLTEDKLSEVANDIISRTINLCKQTIDEAGIKPDAINRIILVGGPTQLPFIRKNLQEKLNITVDTSSDPLTAVARGACIYATSQVIPNECQVTLNSDENVYKLDLNYDSLTSEEDQMVTGIIRELGNIEKDYFIQIQSQDNTFNTGKIKLKNGKFIANVEVKPNKMNTYWIYLFDSDGQPLETSLDEFAITHGLTVSGAPIPHTIGVAISKKDYATNTLKQEFHPFFEKNSILPLEKTYIYKSIKRIDINSDENNNALPITVYEGENSIPEHNTFICEVAVTPDKLDFDLPEGSDIEVTIKIDESRTLTLEAYIPIMDKSFNARATSFDEDLSIAKMQDDVNQEIKKLGEIEHLCSYDEKESVYGKINEIKGSLKNSENDEDEKRKTNAKIKQLQSDLDNLVCEKNEDAIIQKFYDLVDNIEQSLARLNLDDSSDFSKRFYAIKKDGEQAISDKNILLLNKINEQLDSLEYSIIVSDDYTWIYWFKNVIKKSTFTDSNQAEYYINKGLEALQNKDMNTLKGCVRSLYDLLPQSDREELESKAAGITI